jgi:hypothetical protein
MQSADLDDVFLSLTGQPNAGPPDKELSTP